MPVAKPVVLPPPAASWEQFDERLRSWPPVSPERREWLATQRAIEPFVAEGLRRTRDSGDWSGFELYVLAVFGHPSRAYTDTLCAVLDDERHEAVNSEDVVDALFDVADPAAVPSLRRAVTWVPDWDEFGQLARKAVWALDRIGTPEAVAAIREEVADDAPFNVVEAAREAFERIEDEDAAFARLRAALPDDLPPPASPDLVEQAEAQVGEPIPRLLRRVYLELADHLTPPRRPSRIGAGQHST